MAKIKNKASLNRAEVLRYLSCKSVDEITDRYITECEALLLEKCTPAYVYGCFDVDTSGGKAVIDKYMIFGGADIKKHLSQSRKCAVMAVTLGIEADRQIRSLSVTSVAKAVVMDACATAYIEQLCDMVQGEISQKHGNVNFRYSPGYGDFPIDAQFDILKLLDAQRKIGLTLSGTKMLIPSKSVTAVLGFVDEDTACRKTKCEGCLNKTRCEYSK